MTHLNNNNKFQINYKINIYKIMKLILKDKTKTICKILKSKMVELLNA